MKQTNTNEFNAKVKAYLVPIIEQKAEDYEVEKPENPFQWLVETAYSEVKHEFDRNGTIGGLEYWLSGLGMNIDFYNGAIVEIAEDWHDCKLTDNEADMVIAKWFCFMAHKIIMFADKEDKQMKNIKRRIWEKQPLTMWILAVVDIGQALVTFATLGMVQPKWREYMLFSCEWVERLEKWETYQASYKRHQIGA